MWQKKCSAFREPESPSAVKWLACLLLDPRFAGSNPAEDDGFLRAIKIRSTTSFGGKVKPSAQGTVFLS
jgi:hypothetical protein